MDCDELYISLVFTATLLLQKFATGVDIRPPSRFHHDQVLYYYQHQLYHILGALSVAQEASAPRHRIYLLTIWEERSRDPQAPAQWRFRLEHPATGQRQGFASLEALVAALKQLTSEEEDLGSKEAQDDTFDE